MPPVTGPPRGEQDDGHREAPRSAEEAGQEAERRKQGQAGQEAGGAHPRNHHRAGIPGLTLERLAVELDDVEAAAARIGGLVRRTPLLPLDGTPLWLKCEGFQETGSFKLRGASNAVAALAPPGVVTASSGNHGRAVAFAAARAGIPCVVVMTPDATPFKRAAIAALGARIVDSPPGTSARNRTALAVAEAEGLTYVPPYDDALVIAGQGTAGLEIAEEMPRVGCVVVPVGGGGLISGVSTAVRGRLGAGVRVVGVEPLDGNDTVLSRAAGERVEIPQPRTICDGARVQMPGALTFPVVQRRVDDVVAVDDAGVVAAMRLLALSGVYAEPTGALSVAGALHLGLGEGTVCVVSGRNIEPSEWARLAG
jgi:threo-3-hydroxy-L-aspartate ammonia-lyase